MLARNRQSGGQRASQSGYAPDFKHVEKPSPPELQDLLKQIQAERMSEIGVNTRHTPNDTTNAVALHNARRGLAVEDMIKKASDMGFLGRTPKVELIVESAPDEKAVAIKNASASKAVVPVSKMHGTGKGMFMTALI